MHDQDGKTISRPETSGNKDPRRPLLVLAGPTACGKTALSILLAQRLNGAIISADSMQVYRGMDIGSAKIRPEEMCGVEHALIDVLEPTEPFDVYRFQQMARTEIARIEAAGKLPIIVGGTGFYIQALVRDIDFTEADASAPYRASLAEYASRQGADALHARLEAVDPDAAASIHPNNIKRVIRALEYYEQTGRPISAHNEAQRAKASPYRLGYFVLSDDRQALYARIERRVDAMIEAGLEEEVRALYDSGLSETHTSMKGLGYREWFPYFRGEITREEVIRRIKLDTRHFAKRQMTWFRREPDVITVDRRTHQDDDAILAYICEKWKEIQHA